MNNRIKTSVFSIRVGLAAALFFLLSACAGTAPEAPPGEPVPIELPPKIKPAEVKLPPLPPGAAPWEDLIRRLAADGLPVGEAIGYFSAPEAVFDPRPMKRKLWELYRLQYKAERTRMIQEGLAALGYTPGDADGLAGDNTRRAIRAFQEIHGLPLDGEPGDALLQAIRADLALPERMRPKARKTLVTSTAGPAIHRGYLTPERLAEAEAFMLENREPLDRMEKAFGVPGEFVVGILRVETHFGRYLGEDRAFTILASMAACTDFNRIRGHLTEERELDDDELSFMKTKAGEKGRWAYEELRALIEYARANRLAVSSIPGSIYGAIGISQFMPTSAIRWGADGDGDGRVNLFALSDAIHSIGAYFREHGWQGDMSDPEKQRNVIYEYNRSAAYVNTVMAVARHLMDVNRGGAAPSADQ